jgi:hypothetical protein
MLTRMRKAQSTLEYALLIGVVVGALLYMQNYLKRSIQGQIQKAGDQIGEAYSPELTYRSENTFVLVPTQEEFTTRGSGSLTSTNVTDASQDTVSFKTLKALDEEIWTATGGSNSGQGTN